MQDDLKSLYVFRPTDRIFPIARSYLHREMSRDSTAAGVKRIRIHDLRHSHVSLLIEMGFSAVAIAERVGYESIDITYRYACLLQKEIVVQGNPRVYKALRNQLDAVLMELRRIEFAGQMEPERMDQIAYIVRIMEGLNEKHDT
ncbi:MAG: tyrosine-type recombinase/integrase [Aristaeellaceae bacterium]